MPAQKTFRSIRVRGLAQLEGGVSGLPDVDTLPRKLVAQLTQNGTDAPTFHTIFRNTLGGVPAVTRVSAGVSHFTLAGAFPAGKVMTQETRARFSAQNRDHKLERVDDNTLRLSVFLTTGAAADITGLTMPLDITVYK